MSSSNHLFQRHRHEHRKLPDSLEHKVSRPEDVDRQHRHDNYHVHHHHNDHVHHQVLQQGDAVQLLGAEEVFHLAAPLALSCGGRTGKSVQLYR